MSVIEDYSRQAKAELIAVLRERAQRFNACLISDANINRIIKERFTVNSTEAWHIREAVIPKLLEAGVLEIWGKGKTAGTIYRVCL